MWLTGPGYNLWGVGGRARQQEPEAAAYIAPMARKQDGDVQLTFSFDFRQGPVVWSYPYLGWVSPPHVAFSRYLINTPRDVSPRGLPNQSGRQ